MSGTTTEPTPSPSPAPAVPEPAQPVPDSSPVPAVGQAPDPLTATDPDLVVGIDGTLDLSAIVDELAASMQAGDTLTLSSASAVYGEIVTASNGDLIYEPMTGKAFAALTPDCHGGTMLALGQLGSVDFAGTSISQLHASNFHVG